ncbi:MAG: alpha/beta fold hydrolase [Solirubrobacteraceae bacterium]|nr:alpha/beta fold hydrolase [Solirubrobacteraceae bacterium]
MREPLIEHRLELAGFGTRALELEGEGPPVLLIHGFADSADTWRLTLDRLAAEGRRALAIDLPGFGEADPLRPKGPVLEQYDEVVAEAIAHLAEDGGRVIVAGNSLGGCMTLRIGSRADLPLAGLVPVAPAGLDMPRWFQIIERDLVVRGLLGSPVPMPGAVVRRMVGEAYRQLAFARPRAAPGDLVRSFTRHHADARAVSRFLDVGRRMLPELSIDAFELERISVPLLLVWGDRDRMVSCRGARHVLDAVSGARYEELAGCGHCPQLEEPGRFGDLLLGFAAERARATSAA